MHRLSRRQILKIVFVTLTFIWTAFIFSNSFENSSQSGAKSVHILELINKIIYPNTISEYFLRKTAHALEYAVLGALMFITMYIYTKNIRSHVIYPLFFGLVTPVTDECIQLFSDGRAGILQDVVLDYCGFVVGLTISVIITVALKARCKNTH